jgi:hypothetical protein
VHVRRTRRDNHRINAERSDLLGDERLPRLAAHILGRERTMNPRQFPNGLGHFFTIDIPRDVLAAPTCKYANFHESIP